VNKLLTKNRMQIISTLLIILTMSIGCAAPWNNNFPKVAKGMTKVEVQKLLGNPRSSEGRNQVDILYFRLASSPLDTDGSDTREYYVAFHEEKVISYGERLDDATMMRSIQQFEAAWGAVGAAQEAGRQVNAPQQTQKTAAPFSPSDFPNGWKTGYAEGWKEIKGQNAVPPAPPVPPIPPVNRDSYKDGYNLGFIAGMNAAKRY
jgi:hypothetical protein